MTTASAESATESLSERVVTPLLVTKRLAAEGRWKEAEPVRDLMMKECRQRGMSKEQAQDWTYEELDRLYPPLPTPEITATLQDDVGNGDSTSQHNGDSLLSQPTLAHAREGHLAGLDQIPPDWPQLTDNAALPVELSWVQAQRLRIVEERPNGSTIVHLGRAGSPAPSHAALGWLETSIRSYAKFVDICAKGLGQQELESDITKRERRSIEDVRSLLSETLLK